MNEHDKEKKLDDDPKSEYLRMQDKKGAEHDAAMAPQQNRPPAEQHRGGPLPNQKR
jgi:hypothetical protein